MGSLGEIGVPAVDVRRLSVLVVHEELPTYDRQSGSLRMRRYVELMVDEGHEVTFLARAGWEQERYAEELRALGVEVHPLDARRLRGAGFNVPGLGIDLALLLARKRFDLAYLNFYETAERYLPDIRALSPATRILIDTHDVHHLRERRGAELAGDAEALAEADRTREREAAIYSQADVLTAVSEDDARALRELAPDVPVEIITNVHPEASPGPPFEQRSGLVFVANFEHAPNVDAILDFHATSWPLIAEAIPDAQLKLVGWAPPPAVRALASTRVTVTGQVPEVAPYLDAARISIAPLRYGAGVKGKIGEAMMHGLPVVTTPIGAEGMGLIDGDHALIAEPGADFAAAVVRLYHDAQLWEHISTTARAHVDERHGTGAAVASLRRAFAHAVPACFIARLHEWSAEAVATALNGYLSAFTAQDRVTLVVPVTETDPEPDAVYELLADAIERRGDDPDHVPDIAVMPSAQEAPIPSRAVVVDGGTAVELDWVAAAAGALAPDGAAPQSPNQPRASIVIPAYGKREMTERCLAALDHHLGERLGSEIELVLVDNHSPDSTLELFAQWSQRATVVALPRNLNFAGGVNAGAHAARGGVLLVISTDMEMGPGSVDAMIDEVSKPGVGLVGVRMTYPDGTLQHAGIGWRGFPTGIQPSHFFHHEWGTVPLARATIEIGAVTGGCIAVRADLFELVGGFDDGYVNGWEDSDLCLAIRSTGASVRMLGDVDVIHHEGVTSGGRYNEHGNPRRFFGRWAAMLTDDSRHVTEVLGARFNPMREQSRPVDGVGGAGLRLVGPIVGVEPRSAEARGMLRSLRYAGLDVAARTPTPTWVTADLEEPLWYQLATAHSRPASPAALTVSFGPPELASEPSGPGTGTVLRTGTAVPPRAGDAVAWAPCPSAVEALLAQGWSADAVELVAPTGIEGQSGSGGTGALVLLPTHDRALTATLLASLRELDVDEIAVMPSVRTPELGRALREGLPRAQLLSPSTNEQVLADRAASADLVVAIDPADEFDRQALTAAASGAAVIVRPGGPAAWVLGELALPAGDPAPDFLGTATAQGWETSSSARAARSEAVQRACGLVASANALAQLLRGAREDLRRAA